MSLGWLYSALNSAERDLANCETAVANAKSKRDKAKTRRDAVKALVSDLKWDFDSNCNNINSRAGKVKNELEDGLKGTELSNIQTIMDDIDADKEEQPESDANLSESIEALETEIADLQKVYDDEKTKISNYNSRISGLKSDIWSYKTQIWALEAAEKLTDNK